MGPRPEFVPVGSGERISSRDASSGPYVGRRRGSVEHRAGRPALAVFWDGGSAMTRERLQKYLARCGVASRRASEQIILNGRVRVNGEVAVALGTSVDPERDRVELDGRAVVPPATLTYVALNKPIGVVSTARDPRGRRTVLDLVPEDARLYPVGRLDYDSEGLILLTDDGELAMQLTHPRHNVEREYRALLRGDVTDGVLRRLSAGLELDGSRTAPATFEHIETHPDGDWVRVVLHEGRNRQIRRMVEAVGLDVVRLVRVRVGSLQLGDLAPGAWRLLSAAEVAALRGVRD
jgi:23S rRNA pseudouridine2605 synthase